MANHRLLDIASAVAHLHAGDIIAYPTEAVFGLGCDPGNEASVRKLLAMKGRHETTGFVLVASDFAQLEPWIADTAKNLREKALQTWPGPVTWLFPRAADVADYIAGRHRTIAVRITAHEPCRALCTAFGSALVSTSANPNASKPARSAASVAEYFGQKLAGVLTGPLGGAQYPSEIRDLASDAVIRPG